MGVAIMGGGSVNMGGGGMSGDVGAGLNSPAGILATLQGILSFMPSWLANLTIAVLLLLAAALVGYIVGQVIGRILYPNPDKQSLLNKQQKFACLGAVVAAFAITIYALNYQPKPKDMGESLPVGGEMLPEGEGGEGTDDIMPGEDGGGIMPRGEDGEALPEGEGATDGESSGSDKESSSQASSEPASSEAGAAASSTPSTVDAPGLG